MMSLNSIKKSGFEPAHTTQSLIYFTSKNGGDKLNLLDKRYAPVSTYSFSITTINKSLTLTPLQLSIDFPVALQLIKTVEVEFIDNDDNFIREFIIKKYNELFTDKESLSGYNTDELLKESWELVIEIYNKQKELKISYFLSVIPIDDLTIRGDQDYSLGTLPVKFTVLGATKK